MSDELFAKSVEKLKKLFSEKFRPIEAIFKNIHRGDRIFIHTGCGEPQYLVKELVNFVEKHPKELFDTELLQVWTLDLAPYTAQKFKSNFRHNSMFLGRNTRDAVNCGDADYTPVFLSNVPDLFYRKLVPLDVALIQVSPPDEHGYLSLGVSVDIVKAATDVAGIIIAELNPNMPRVLGDGVIHIDDIDFIVPYDEPVLTYKTAADNEIAIKIGEHVASLVQDGDTIQVGYGAIPNAVLANLKNKKHLGVHTELLSDGIVSLMKNGVIDNSRKTINRGKAVASFCMGSKDTYDYIDDNPSIDFRRIEYTNSPLVIAQHENMVAINSALEIDLTGQASAETLGTEFYSSVGGQADFMRGTMLSKSGRTILTLQSTADDGKISRIVPRLPEGSGVTLHRADVHYIVTEYGIAYLHGKNIRERAMELISIAHPKFKVGLIKEAKAMNLIYQDQAFISGKRGEYPEDLETYRTTEKGFEIFLRPVRLGDESLLKDFFYSLSDKSLHRRFMSERKDMPHERLQDFVVIDFTKEIVILAILKKGNKKEILGVGQYAIDPNMHSAEVAFAVRDDYHNKGIGFEMLSYLTFLARRKGLLGFSAEVLVGNTPMLHVFEKMGFDIDKKADKGVYELRMKFRGTE